MRESEKGEDFTFSQGIIMKIKFKRFFGGKNAFLWSLQSSLSVGIRGASWGDWGLSPDLYWIPFQTCLNQHFLIMENLNVYLKNLTYRTFQIINCDVKFFL